MKWNEPYQKLASCDSTGIIFVWIKYEGRWSIELINDRNTPVTHFSWSHDGRMALICYQVRCKKKVVCQMVGNKKAEKKLCFNTLTKSKLNLLIGWICAGWFGSGPTILVIDAES